MQIDIDIISSLPTLTINRKKSKTQGSRYSEREVDSTQHAPGDAVSEN